MRLVLSCRDASHSQLFPVRSGPVRSCPSGPVRSGRIPPGRVLSGRHAARRAGRAVWCRDSPSLGIPSSAGCPVPRWACSVVPGVQCRDGCAVSCRDSPTPLPCWACPVAPTLAVPCRDLPSLALPCRAVFEAVPRAACGLRWRAVPRCRAVPPRVPRAVRGCDAGAVPCRAAMPRRPGASDACPALTSVRLVSRRRRVPAGPRAHRLLLHTTPSSYPQLGTNR